MLFKFFYTNGKTRVRSFLDDEEARNFALNEREHISYYHKVTNAEAVRPGQI